MHGLVSLLPEPYYQQVEQIWKELEEEHGLKGIRVTPYPHFSWQIAQDYDFDRLAETMQEVAFHVQPLPVHTAGIGIFTGPRPVIYIRIVKSAELIRFHEMVWERTQDVSQGLSPHYHPGIWMPHISLAYEDVAPENISGVVAKLAFIPFNWQMQIDNISLIYEPSGQTGVLKYHFEFSGQSKTSEEQ